MRCGNKNDRTYEDGYADHFGSWWYWENEGVSVDLRPDECRAMESASQPGCRKKWQRTPQQRAVIIGAQHSRTARINYLSRS